MIYFIADNKKRHVKIGFTREKNAKCRLRHIQVGCPFKLKIIHTMEGGIKAEKNLHEIFALSHENGEWFKYTNDIDLFLSYPNQVQEILVNTIINKTKPCTLFTVIQSNFPDYYNELMDKIPNDVTKT